MNSKYKRVAVAMSGGVDSCVAAALLVEEGYEVIGLWMHLSGEGHPERYLSFRDALRSAKILKIPLYAIDLRRLFQEEIINYFLREYLAGRTPNPCALCNPKIKFGALMERAWELGAELFATGHYARVKWDCRAGRFLLLRGIDRAKDQSYFLWGLSQRQLSRCIFPNGELSKEEVGGMAKKMGFPLTERGESQQICFIPEGDYREFLRTRLKKRLPPRGEIVDKNGRPLGRHKGIFSFTIGQRRGIGIPSRRPYYVLRIDPAANQVVVGAREDLFARRLVAKGMNWISIPPPQEKIRAMGKIRYRHSGSPCTVTPSAGDEVAVEFDEPQEAITPGQALVLYQDEVLLGGGWIKEVNNGEG
ncbi:MAG: tRNA 2-thiouridine(34) synthase MnmA [Deltaproteobacteria bacterium]|nr:MAG: tRNA 2-thiouridine(34) synthase MnmA [Deltaproteobacteria bacterium]